MAVPEIKESEPVAPAPESEVEPVAAPAEEEAAEAPAAAAEESTEASTDGATVKKQSFVKKITSSIKKLLKSVAK